MFYSKSGSSRPNLRHPGRARLCPARSLALKPGPHDPGESLRRTITGDARMVASSRETVERRVGVDRAERARAAMVQ
eukprot:5057076-Pyramimonas_sp.AAC.1